MALLAMALAGPSACGGGALATPALDGSRPSPTPTEDVEEGVDEEENEPEDGGEEAEEEAEYEAEDEDTMSVDAFVDTYLEVVGELEYLTSEPFALLEDPELDDQARYDALIELSNAYDYAAEELGIYAFPAEVQADVDDLGGELGTFGHLFFAAAEDSSLDVEDIVARLSILSEIGGRIRETVGLPPPTTPITP